MNKYILVVVLSMGLFTTGTAQDKTAVEIQSTVKTEIFTVYGNCGMCERTIESSLKDVKGISLVDWDMETDDMKVSYDSQLISLDEIKQKIAEVGYDTETHRAKDSVYSELPGCCQYERPK